MIFTKPAVRPVPSARPLMENGNCPVRTARPSALHCCSVFPTQAISGLV
jgi:hypothetical protein